MKVIKINLISKSITEHDADENFIHDLLNTDKVNFQELENFTLIYPVFTNIEKCFSLKLFPNQLIMANAILVGGTIDNYKDVPFDCETIRDNTYFLHDKQIVAKEIDRLNFNSKIFDKFHITWYDKLKVYLQSSNFKDAVKSINEERKMEVVIPNNNEMFKQFEKEFSKDAVIFYPTSSKNSKKIWEEFMTTVNNILTNNDDVN